MRRQSREFMPAVHRLAILFAIGVVAAVIAAILTPGHLAVLIGWDVSAISFVALTWGTVGRYDSTQTAARATLEDNTRVTAHLLLLSASVASLAGTGVELYRASSSSGAEKFVLSAIGVFTVVVSWSVVHTVFALRYAHLYYIAPVGGIDFKNDADPDYGDFAYVAFTVGMTFQVADTDIQSSVIRRTVLRQALISYLFGAVILAVVVNVVSGVIF